ncbi:MAG: UpxY family transcription antiterminator [Flavobacterium sp.]|nr:UpxY family transcription antiterminator [Flavobacterium sp.]
MENVYNGWFVLYVKSRFEKKVHNSLIELSLESYLPMVNEVHNWSDRKKLVSKPLFSSYVFINIKSVTEFYKALTVDGACMFIRFGKEFAKVTSDEINTIKTLINNKEITEIQSADSSIPKIGDFAQINSGPLKGFDCVVLSVNNKNKIIVRINSLQLNITATVPSNYLLSDQKTA